MQSLFRYRFLHAKVAFVVCALVSASSYAQNAEPTQVPSMQSTLLSMIVPLVLVVGAMILALVVVRRRYGLVSNDGPLRVKQILAVGPRERVVLLEGSAHTIVIGVTSAQVSRIAVLPREGSRAQDERDEA